VTAVVKSIGSWLRPRLGVRSRASTNRSAHSGGHRRQSPIVLAEIVAASSFLDFGGVPDPRYFHTLYDWRLCEAPRDTSNKWSDKNGCLPRQLIAGGAKDVCEDDPTEAQSLEHLMTQESKPLPWWRCSGIRPPGRIPRR
jgi:hypothetical protein